MAGKGFNKVLSVILIIVVLLIIGALGFIGYDYVLKRYINTSDAAKEIEEIDNYIRENNPIAVEVPDENNNNTDEQEGESTYQGSGYLGYNPNKKYGLKYKGYGVVGKIELPAVGLQYPILETLTDANAIDVSVAMQYGAGINQVGNTIIMGHNYRNGTFFGSNKRLSVGDKVYITDMTGKKIEYTIYKKYLTPQEDFSYADRDTQGKREVTLVTCHTDNRYRLIIFARE